MKPIYTERLIIRPVTLDDAAFIFAITNDVDFKKYIGDRGVHDTESAIQYIQQGPLASYQQHRIGLMIVVLQDSNALIGTCGLLQRDYLDCPDIGFAFLPQYRHSGYAYEAAKAVMEDARSRLNITKIAGLVSPNNNASIKLLEKLGLQFAEQQNLESSTLTDIYYVHG